MKIINYPNKDSYFNNKKFTMIMGAFETIHISHFMLIQKAKEFNLPVIMMIIDNPDALPKNYNKKNVYDLQTRLAIISELEIDVVLQINFNVDTQNQDGKEFIDNIINNYNIEYFVIGQDFKFGSKASWDGKKLLEYFPNTKIFEIEKIDKIKISTNLVRDLITVGDIDGANSILIAPVGFSTSIFSDKSLIVNDKLVKYHPGLYASIILFEDFIYHGILKIDLDNNYEIYPLDFDIKNPIEKAFVFLIKEVKLFISNQNNLIDENVIKKAKQICINYDKIIENKRYKLVKVLI